MPVSGDGLKPDRRALATEDPLRARVLLRVGSPSIFDEQCHGWRGISHPVGERLDPDRTRIYSPVRVLSF